MRCKLPVRLLIASMIFFTTFTNYMLRANMSASITQMTKPIGGGKKPSCPREGHKPNQSTSTEKFHWDETTQGLVIGAYFYGTMVTFLPGGAMAEMLGPVNVIFWTSLVSAILTGVTPQITEVGGWGGIFAVRFILGVLGGPVYPALNTLIAKWAPPAEKGKFLSMLLGNTIGVVITWIVVGKVGENNWHAGFYSVGGIMAGYSLLFILVTADTPQKHRWISAEEREYIESSQAGTVSKEKSKKLPPYWQMIKSFRFWATIIAQFGNLWAINLGLTYLPKYFKETLNYNLKDKMIYAASPYIARLMFSQVFGIVGDYMRKKQFMSVTNIRKFFVILSHIVPAICFCCIYAARCELGLVLFLLIANQALNGAVVVGHLVTCQDLSPNFAGTLYGIMNWLGSTTGFMVPAITSAFLKKYDDDKILGSGIIFGLGGGVLILTAVIFLALGSAEIQPFNYAHQEAPPQEQQTPQPTS